jgi:uncharacterized membrane protein YhaH (DUF805 family)
MTSDTASAGWFSERRAARSTAPSEAPPYYARAMQREEHWYSIHGRITRLTWLLRIFAGAFTMLCLVALVTALTPHDSYGGRESDATRLPAVGLILCFLVFRFIQDTKRLHDLGKPGAYVICAFIPIVNLIYTGFIVFADGQPHTNEYGVDPKGRGSDIDDVADVFR